jgi:hypothetical protein
MLRNIEDCGTKRVFLNALRLEVFDDEEQCDDALLVGEQLDHEMPTL